MITTGIMKYKGREYYYINYETDVKLYALTQDGLLEYVRELHEQWFRENTIYLEFENEGDDYKCL